MSPGDASDAALEQQAQQMAESALAGLPEEVREAKLAAVKQGILKRLRSQSKATAAPKAAPPATPPPPAQVPAQAQAARRGIALAASCAELEKVGAAEACGDEPWFADDPLRKRLQEAARVAHAEQKLLVGSPAEEIRRICPKGHTLGAGAVLRLGGAHHGGYGDADVKYAYRQLSRALHPDKNPGVEEAPEAFRRLSEAADELKQGLEVARQAVHKLCAATCVPRVAEERPQGPLIAEASRLLAAVLGLTGEGAVPEVARGRAVDAFSASKAIYGACPAGALMSAWYDGDSLLEVLADATVRIAYDCMPKRIRAQFLCVLNRAVAAEAARNDSCVRGPWQRALGRFPEIGLWRDLLEKVQRRVWMGSDGENKHRTRWDDKTSTASTWASGWRDIISDVLPHGSESAALATDHQLRLLLAALWEDVAKWAVEDGSATVEVLFAAEGAEGGAAVGVGGSRWAFIPAMDLLLTVGEGLVGITAEGAFTATGPKHGRRRTFAGALRCARHGDTKRGLAAPCAADETRAKEAKLNRGPTRVVMLTNLVGTGEVDTDLKEEIAEEAAKYGKLKSCTIKEVSSAVDKEAVRVFLEFEKVEEAAKAYADMNGRLFDGRTVKARFFDEERHARGDLDRERKVQSRILLLTNLVGPEDVDEDLEVETATEAAKFGKLKRCIVRQAAETGKLRDCDVVRIFLEYEQADDASKAAMELNGRIFGGRELKVRPYDEELYARGDLSQDMGQLVSQVQSAESSVEKPAGLKPQDLVEVVGLDGTELNGQRGVVVGNLAEQGRFEVRLDSGEVVNLKPGKLKRVMLPLSPGDVVEVYGLESASGRQLNGQLGTVVQHHEDSCRFELRLAAGKLVRMRPENLKRLGLEPGTCVEVFGLESEGGKQLNGQRGVVTGYLEDSERFEVRFVALDRQVSLRHVNLRPPREEAPISREDPARDGLTFL